MKKIILIILCLVALALLVRAGVLPVGSSSASPQALQEAVSPPRQGNVAPQAPFRVGHYTVTRMASYDVTARILSARRYSIGRESDLSPIDLALGWGLMAVPRVTGNISITQRNRFYYWRTSDLPIPQEQIVSSSANTHIIPANDEVRKVVMGLRRGEIARMKGYLVVVQGDDGWRWESSYSRDDSGNHACELFYVEQAARL